MWDGLPKRLRQHKAWLRWAPDARRQPKAPRNAEGRICDANDSGNWMSFDEAREHSAIGVVLYADDDLIGIDLDHVLTEDEEPLPWVPALIKELDTYCEISPSGRGLRLFVTDPSGRICTSQSKHQSVYSERRFLTVTGTVYHDAPIRETTRRKLQRLLKDTNLHKQPVDIADDSRFDREDHGRTVDEVFEQASDYLAGCEDSIQGYSGDEQMFKIVSVLLFDFGLPVPETKQLAYWFGKHKSRPRWSERDIDHKIKFSLERYRPQDDKKLGWRVESKVDLTDFDDEGDTELTELPEWVYDVEGFIGNFYRWQKQTCHRNQPQYFLGAAIATFSAIIGGCVTDTRGNWPNIYALLIGSSGTGKQHPNNLVRDLLSAIDDYDLFDFSPTSDAAASRALQRDPIRLWLWEECGAFLRNGSEHSTSLLSTMVKLFNGRTAGKDYSDDRKSFHVHDCHLSVIGSTVPTNFFGSLSEENLVDGFASRWLIFQGDNAADIVAGEKSKTPRALRKCAEYWRGQRLCGDEPLVLGLSGDAKEYFDQLNADAETRRRGTDSEARRAIYSRIAEMTLKLAISYEMSVRGLDADVYSLDGLKWAREIVLHSVGTLLAHIEHWVAGDEFSDRQNQVLRFLNEKGRISKGRLYNRFWRWPIRDRDSVVRSLTPGKVTEEKNGRTTYYEIRVRR